MNSLNFSSSYKNDVVQLNYFRFRFVSELSTFIRLFRVSIIRRSALKMFFSYINGMTNFRSQNHCLISDRCILSGREEMNILKVSGR